MLPSSEASISPTLSVLATRGPWSAAEPLLGEELGAEEAKCSQRLPLISRWDLHPLGAGGVSAVLHQAGPSPSCTFSRVRILLLKKKKKKMK